MTKLWLKTLPLWGISDLRAVSCQALKCKYFKYKAFVITGLQVSPLKGNENEQPLEQLARLLHGLADTEAVSVGRMTSIRRLYLEVRCFNTKGLLCYKNRQHGYTMVA